MRIIIAVFLFVVSAMPSLRLFGQAQSQSVFRFTNMVTSPRAAGMGGNLINVKDYDLSLAYANPALLSPDMDNQVHFSFVKYLAKSNYGMFSYAKSVENVGTFAVNLQFAGYGKFDETDEAGNVIGSFKANNTGINLAGARNITDRFSVGAQLKFLFSSLERYTAFGMGIDVAGTYDIPEAFLTTSLVFKNMGYQLTSYYNDADKSALPFEIQLGVSKKMKHAPFRLSLVLENLQNWNLRYIDPTQSGQRDPLTGQPVELEEPGFGKEILLHMVIGLEVVFSENVMMQLGYNFRRRDELKTPDKPGISGFTGGFGARFGAFKLAYGIGFYNQAGIAHNFSFAMFFNELKKEKSLN